MTPWSMIMVDHSQMNMVDHVLLNDTMVNDHGRP